MGTAFVVYTAEKAVESALKWNGSWPELSQNGACYNSPGKYILG